MEINGLEYNPDTGEFKWTVSRKGVKKGKIAGCKDKTGYIRIRYNNQLYSAHRLAFLFMTGKLPELHVDHIDCIRSNNRWKNLREVTPSQNSCNRLHGDLPLGVYIIERKGRKGIWYRTFIQKDKKTYSSVFRNKENAIKWRTDKEKELFGTYRYEKIQ